MIEIFIAVALGIVLGVILYKYGKDIILFPIIFVLYLILTILSIPGRIILFFTSNQKIEQRLLREYDRIFFEAESMKMVERIRKKIVKLELIFHNNTITKHDKETVKWLNEAKWLI